MGEAESLDRTPARAGAPQRAVRGLRPGIRASASSSQIIVVETESPAAGRVVLTPVSATCSKRHANACSPAVHVLLSHLVMHDIVWVIGPDASERQSDARSKHWASGWCVNRGVAA